MATHHKSTSYSIFPPSISMKKQETPLISLMRQGDLETASNGAKARPPRSSSTPASSSIDRLMTFRIPRKQVSHTRSPSSGSNRMAKPIMVAPSRSKRYSMPRQVRNLQDQRKGFGSLAIALEDDDALEERLKLAILNAERAERIEGDDVFLVTQSLRAHAPYDKPNQARLKGSARSRSCPPKTVMPLDRNMVERGTWKSSFHIATQYAEKLPGTTVTEIRHGQTTPPSSRAPSRSASLPGILANMSARRPSAKSGAAPSRAISVTLATKPLPALPREPLSPTIAAAIAISLPKSRCDSAASISRTASITAFPSRKSSLGNSSRSSSPLRRTAQSPIPAISNLAPIPASPNPAFEGSDDIEPHSQWDADSEYGLHLSDRTRVLQKMKSSLHISTSISVKELKSRASSALSHRSASASLSPSRTASPTNLGVSPNSLIDGKLTEVVECEVESRGGKLGRTAEALRSQNWREQFPAGSATIIGSKSARRWKEAMLCARLPRDL